jgi:DNA-binding response OmpR family regulator
MSGRTAKILVVDDDEHIAEAIRLALEDRGHDVLVARDGAEAMVRLERDAPDLVVLDVVMPKRSGFVVLDQIRRSRRQGLKVVMLTANTDPRHREYAESRGVDAFLQKPFDLELLVDRVEELLA